MYKKLASTVIINKNNKILLMLRDNKPGILNPGKWGLIGGHGKKNETPRQIAVREIKEETGLIVDKKQLKPFMIIKNSQGQRDVFLLKGDWRDKNIIKGEGQDIKFIKLNKALKLRLGVNQRYILSYLNEFGTNTIK